MPELREQADVIWKAPVLDDVAVDHPHDVEHGDANRSAGRRVSLEGPVVRAGGDVTGPHDVVSHGEVFDRETEIGESRPQGSDHGLDARSTARMVGAAA